MIGFLDIPHEVIEKAYREIQKKKGCCRILPAARVNICDDGALDFGGLVCDNRMGGEQTGVGAGHCHNCEKKKR